MQHYIKDIGVYISIYLMTDGRTFVIIVNVIERKFEKQKLALLNWSVLSRV